MFHDRAIIDGPARITADGLFVAHAQVWRRRFEPLSGKDIGTVVRNGRDKSFAHPQAIILLATQSRPCAGERADPGPSGSKRPTCGHTTNRRTTRRDKENSLASYCGGISHRGMGRVVCPRSRRGLKVIDPPSVAREYAAAHYSPHTFQPKGAPLAFQVEEHGDFWTVHLAPQGYVGGGLQLMIRRQDGQVISAMRSQ